MRARNQIPAKSRRIVSEPRGRRKKALARRHDAALLCLTASPSCGSWMGDHDTFELHLADQVVLEPVGFFAAHYRPHAHTVEALAVTVDRIDVSAIAAGPELVAQPHGV